MTSEGTPGMHEAVTEVKRKWKFKFVLKSHCSFDHFSTCRNYANGPLLNMHQVIDGLFAAEASEIINDVAYVLEVVLD